MSHNGPPLTGLMAFGTDSRAGSDPRQDACGVRRRRDINVEGGVGELVLGGEGAATTLGPAENK